MRGTSGMLLLGIGVLHTVYGAFMGTRVLSEISGATFSGETTRQLVTSLGREFAFWFLFSGFLMLVLGHLFLWIERRLGRPVPGFIGWELLGLSVLGLVVLPVSGFWLVLAVAMYVIFTARRFRQRSAAT